MATFTLVSIAAWAFTVALAATLRGRLYATFAGIILGIYTLVGVMTLPVLGLPTPLLYYLHATAYVTWLLLVVPRLRPEWFRIVVSYPGLTTSAAVLLSFPWAILLALGLHPPLVWLPYVLALFGLAQSLRTPRADVTVQVGAVEEVAGPVRYAQGVSHELTPGSLRIAQITDPHLGPFMSVKRLKKLCERIAASNPDLVLLTGDYLTMESQTEGSHLEEALSPLAPLAGKTFACLGNHDHEALPLVLRGLRSNGIRVLVDEGTTVTTPQGEVDLVGFDFHFRERKTRISSVTSAFPRHDARLRIALLHDPGAFKHVPEGEFDLVLSGHTHGGQVGLVSLGLPQTVVSWIAKMPDHGLWARGKDRLYVHRGTGHYGYPIRLGVPAEEGLLHVHFV